MALYTLLSKLQEICLDDWQAHEKINDNWDEKKYQILVELAILTGISVLSFKGETFVFTHTLAK